MFNCTTIHTRQNSYKITYIDSILAYFSECCFKLLASFYFTALLENLTFEKKFEASLFGQHLMMKTCDNSLLAYSLAVQY